MNPNIQHLPVALMSEFPDFGVRGFDISDYNRRFVEGNVVIDARAKEVFYPLHWCALSIKCAFNGKEYYQSGNGLYAVDDSSFLILNEGKMYSSWIDSAQEVESYTINIAPGFERDVLNAIVSTDATMLDVPADEKKRCVRFTEKLYPHDQLISPILQSIRRLSKDSMSRELLNERFYFLLEAMYRLQGLTNVEIGSLKKLRPATRDELFQRLVRARDFIHSCYDKGVTLDQIADIACLNRFYLLRQFKATFGLTPHQFLTRRRLEVALSMLLKSEVPIVEACRAVGFEDTASFSKLFRRAYGLSPNAYRKATVNSAPSPIAKKSIFAKAGTLAPA